MALGNFYSLFGRLQQHRSHPETARRHNYVDRDDVAGAPIASFRNNEASDIVVYKCDVRTVLAFPRIGIDWRFASDHFGDQCETASAAHVEPEFGFRIGNTGSKAGLVDAP